jgi:hypothetical protein
VNLCPLTDEPEFAEIDRDHQKVANCLQIGPPQIGTTAYRKLRGSLAGSRALTSEGPMAPQRGAGIGSSR